MTRQETWSGAKPFNITGHFFQLLTTANPVDVELLDRDGHRLALDAQVESGYYVNRGSKTPFAQIIITTSASETVKFLVSDGTSGTTRPSINWFDRNPSSASIQYVANGVAPHTDTVRASYTVPTGKKGFIEACMAKVLRETVAAPVGIAEAFIFVGARLIEAATLGNVVGSSDSVALGQSGWLGAGSVVQLRTADVSTGGTVSYYVSAKVAEFNA